MSQGKRNKYHSLSKRLVTQLCLFTIVLSLIFGMLSFLLLFVVEDSFIEQNLYREAEFLRAQHKATGEWQTPRSKTMSLHFTKASFPEDIRNLAKAEPRRKEFYGEQGRHYHVMQLNEETEIWLLAEVSADLQVRKMRTGILVLLAVSTLLVTLIACLLAWLLARKTTRPLKQLVDLVDGVAPENIPREFAGKFPANEVGILADTLEHTLAQISDALDREKHFTRDVSHELRTPLAIIKNAVEVYRSKDQHESSMAPILDRIYQAASQMQQTVQTLLMLAREEHSSTTKVATDLMPLLEKAILDNSLLLKDKPVDVEVQENCRVTIDASPDMLKVLLDNVLSNAFQYTEAGEVSIYYQEGKLFIRDSGPGIAPEISQTITQAGVKGAQSTGFGFGLSIVKRLCEHQGWRFALNSDKGTIVTVDFNA